ncbi:epoxyqueuosine reductase QueH, partial [Staphylococcus epidermidis]|uniref:epoxyqueuosine reductase QueH n=1 Tax=Staphylococcus epidermidis TaxID=1282 RepID=UPI001643030E
HKALTQHPEAGLTSTPCFHIRLQILPKPPLQHPYHYFPTPITLSPNKNPQLINQLPIHLQNIYNLKYLPTD